MVQSDLLGYLVQVLDRLGIRYFITGSMATIAYGESRLTHDIDIVVALPVGSVPAFCAAFPDSDYYVSEDAARDAAARSGQFNIIHPTSGLKVDVIVPEDTPFNRSRFSRARRLAIHGGEAWFTSMEDVIIKKMDFYREGGSEKHVRDILGMLKVSGSSVDRDYVARWAGELGLDAIWQSILQRIGS